MLTPSALARLQRNYGSVDWSRWQNWRWQQYDYPRYPPAGTTQVQLFSVPLGGQDPNVATGTPKTLEQTNLNSSSSFGDVGFLITQIRTHLRILPKGRQHATIIADADVLWTTMSNMMSKYMEMVRRGVFVLSIQSKEFFTISAPFQTCPPGFGIQIQQHANSYISGHTAYSIWAQQNPDAKDIFDVDPPQFIEPNQTFTAQLNYYDGTSPVFTNLVSGVIVQ